MKAYVELIKVGLRKGYSIAVHSEEDLEITSKDYNEILDMVENLDMSCIEFLDSDGVQQGWASVNLCVNDWETISDYGLNAKWIDQWFNEVVVPYDPYERDSLPEEEEFITRACSDLGINLQQCEDGRGYVATLACHSVIAPTEYQAVKHLYDLSVGNPID